MKRSLREAGRQQQEQPLSWQTGDYSRTQHFQLTLPYSFLLFCKLISLTPKQMIELLLDHLAQGTWNNNTNRMARSCIYEYLKQLNYQQNRFTASEMETLLLEMSVFNHMDLTDANSQFLASHETWRLHYLHHWFNKWYAIAQNRTPGHSHA